MPDTLRQDCERRAEKAFECDCGFSEGHSFVCSVNARKRCADALEEAIRPLVSSMKELESFIAFYSKREVESPSNSQESAREANERLVRFRAALAPYRATPQAEPGESTQSFSGFGRE